MVSHGIWRSLVARLLREQEAAGSNPAIPTHPYAPYAADLLDERKHLVALLLACVQTPATIPAYLECPPVDPEVIFLRDTSEPEECEPPPLVRPRKLAMVMGAGQLHLYSSGLCELYVEDNLEGPVLAVGTFEGCAEGLRHIAGEDAEALADWVDLIGSL